MEWEGGTWRAAPFARVRKVREAAPRTRLPGEPQGLAAVPIIVSHEKRRDRTGWGERQPTAQTPASFPAPLDAPGFL